MPTPQPQFNVQAEDLLARIAQLEAELEAMKHTMDASSQLDSLGLLTGAIAHEFNNILTPVLSYARVAMDHPDDAALTRKALERVTTGIEKATRIAGSVLRLAGSSQQRGGEPHCRVRDALSGALAVLPEPMDQRGVTLRVDLAADLCVRMHQTDLEHVLLNLILNAIRAMEPGGGVLTVGRVSPDDACSTWNIGDAESDTGDGSDAVWIVVSDTGSGMPRQVVDRLGIPVCEPVSTHISPITHSTAREDVQGDSGAASTLIRSDDEGCRRAGAASCDGGGHNATNSERTGSGLGLVITQRLLEAAGASMRVRTQAGMGTAFLLRIPAGRQMSEAVPSDNV